MLDVNWGDLIYHFGDDDYTTSILIYMESVGDARSFVSAAREVSLRKPINCYQAGTKRGCPKGRIFPHRSHHRRRRGV